MTTAYLNRIATAVPPHDVHDIFVRFAETLLGDERGISMAVQSAWPLCRGLIARQSAIAADQMLAVIADEYEAAWWRSFGLRMRAASLIAHVAMRPGSMAPALRLLELFPQALTLGAALSGKARTPVPAATAGT